MLRRCCGRKERWNEASLIRWLVGENNKTTGKCQDSLEGFFFSSALDSVLGCYGEILMGDDNIGGQV